MLLLQPELYEFLSREDHIIEYLSALFLICASLLFFRSFLHSKNNGPSNGLHWRAILFFILSLLFLVAGGEEISWGQRIFDLKTPDYLAHLNDQNEFNFHNINKKFFDRVVDRTTVIFVLLGSILLVMKEEKFFGIKTPDLHTICAFAVTPFYNENNTLNFYHLQYILFIVLIIYFIKHKAKTSGLILIITLIISILIPVIHRANLHLFAAHNNSANEYREFLFCLCCLFYAYLIMNTAKVHTELAKNRS